MNAIRNCDVCGKPVGEWPERHEYHKDTCPNFVIFDSGEDGAPSLECDCDLVAHPDCCPQCNPLNDCDIDGCYFCESGKCLLDKCEDREATE